MGYWLVGEKRSKGLFSYHIEFLCHTNYKSSFRFRQTLSYGTVVYMCMCGKDMYVYKKHK